MQNNFFMPVRVFAGRGALAENGSALANLGRRCLIITSGSAARKSGALSACTRVLEEHGISYRIFDKISENPLLSSCREAGVMARGDNADFLIGIGGGSPLDATKAAAVYATNIFASDAEIYQLNWQNPALPFALIGTTSGTGSEVTRISVLTNDQNGQKKSIAADDLYARISYVDPAFTETVPEGTTVSTALDAFCHAAESLFSSAANEISMLYSLEAIRLLTPRLRDIQMEGFGVVDSAMRDALSTAALLAGFALNATGTCYPHSLGYMLTEQFGIPHGRACTAFLPSYIRRGAQFASEKAVRLCEACGCGIDALCRNLENLAGVHLSLSETLAEETAARFITSRNFAITPGGFTQEEAAALLRRLFPEQ